MSWDNPPIPWHELERRMSWRSEGRGAPRPPRPSEPAAAPVPWRPQSATPWAELHCHSSFSFLDGAAAPDELVAEAARLGLAVLAITDHDGMYGVPQFAQAAARLRARGARLGTVFGAELCAGPAVEPGQQSAPTRPAVTCWSWPATRKDTPGCAP